MSAQQPHVCEVKGRSSDDQLNSKPEALLPEPHGALTHGVSQHRLPCGPWGHEKSLGGGFEKSCHGLLSNKILDFYGYLGPISIKKKNIFLMVFQQEPSFMGSSWEPELSGDGQLRRQHKVGFRVSSSALRASGSEFKGLGCSFFELSVGGLQV